MTVQSKFRPSSYLFVPKFKSVVALLDLESVVCVQKFYHPGKNMSLAQSVSSWNCKEVFVNCKHFGRSVANKIYFLYVGQKAYPFIFNTLLSVLVVTLLIPERYCICLNIKFPASVFRMSFSVLITFLLPLFVSFFPVDTQRRFNVDTTSCLYWVGLPRHLPVSKLLCYFIKLE